MVTVPHADVAALVAAAAQAGVPLARIGATGGDAVALADEAPMAVATLRSAHEDWMPGYMAGELID